MKLTKNNFIDELKRVHACYDAINRLSNHTDSEIEYLLSLLEKDILEIKCMDLYHDLTWLKIRFPNKVKFSKISCEENTCEFKYNGHKMSKRNYINSYEFVYDENHNLVVSYLGSKLSEIYKYDDHGNILSKSCLGGKVYKYTYDDHVNMLTETRPDGFQLTYDDDFCTYCKTYDKYHI